MTFLREKSESFDSLLKFFNILKSFIQLPLKGVNWDTWCELGENLVNRHCCDCH